VVDPPIRGLTSEEVETRIEAGQVNTSAVRSSRSGLAIVRANLFTRFNALLGGLLVVILTIGPLQDATFGIVLVINTSIGILQELRARRTLDRLALLHEPHARVWRDDEVLDLSEADVVLDDLLELRRGDQVVVDGELLESHGLEVDESLLTGEADPVHKTPGDLLRSGSAIVAGSGLMRATAVGEDAFAQRLSSEARRFSLVRSELQEANNRILRLVTWGIAPVAGLLVWSQLSGEMGVKEALRGSVAGVANMIPEGLVLLTSIAFAVSAIRLARQQVLIRELAAVEGLARVDVLCIDKTGTITTGELSALELRRRGAGAAVEAVIGGLAAAEETPSASLQSLAQLTAGTSPLVPTMHIAFSSQRRFSAGHFPDLGWFVLGAPEALIAGDHSSGLWDEIRIETSAGHRVLVLVRAEDGADGPDLSGPVVTVALGILAEEVRPDAAETLAYLASQQVAVKVISGDSPETVAAIAGRVGIATGEPLDATALPAEEAALREIVESHTIFGRVGPREKRALIAALQSAGHVVAMTGDGVNDVLALRDADLGIAMGSGSPACRAAGRVVLLDDGFSRLPGLLGEGRRVLANVERVSKLFVTKTVYAALLAVSIGVVRVPYPFYPRHFTVISTLTIGIPAFFLALPPASTRLRSGYLERVRSFALPVGCVLGAATLAVYLIDRHQEGGTPRARTAAALVLGIMALWVLGRLARPFNWWKIGLVGAMAGSFAGVFLLPAARRVLALRMMSGWTLLLVLSFAIGAILALEGIWRWRGATSGEVRE
jgi:cation-transporting ATPase E